MRKAGRIWQGLLILWVALLMVQFAHAAVKTTKNTYGSNEPIVVEYSGFPGNQTDWITVVPATNKDDSYNEWFYTKGSADGEMTFHALPEGEYEVRAYFNWSEGGYNVTARYKFTVADASGTIKTKIPVYHSNQEIVVTYSGFPGHKQDWIAVMPAASADDKYSNDSYFYTKGAADGEMTFKARPEGDYEARGYFDWPSGGYKVKTRYAFKVADPKEWKAINVETEKYGVRDTGNAELIKKLQESAQDFLEKAAPEIGELTKHAPKVFSTSKAVDVFVTYGCVNTVTGVVTDIKPQVVELPDAEALPWWASEQKGFDRKEPERERALKRNAPRSGCR